MPVGHAAVRKQILIEAMAHHPLPGAHLRTGNKAFQPLLHLLQGGCAAQVALGHRGAQVQKVHMGINKAWADEAAPKVAHLVALPAQSQHLRVAAHRQKPPVLYREGALQRLCAGEYLSVHIQRAHGHTSPVASTHRA